MRRQAGFTLMEVMVSMAIISGMMTVLWGSFSLTVDSKRRVEAIEERYHQLRLATTRMAREISMAYLSKNEMPGVVKPRTRFVGQRNSKIDELIFSSLSHVRLRANAKESDQTLIRYYGERDNDDRGVTNLMRRSTRRLGVENPGEDGPSYIMLEDVEELHFSYFDEKNNEWRDTWSTIAADGQPDRLPTKVRVELTLVNETGKETTYRTSTRIFLQDPLWFTSGS